MSQINYTFLLLRKPNFLSVCLLKALKLIKAILWSDLSLNLGNCLRFYFPQFPHGDGLQKQENIVLIKLVTLLVGTQLKRERVCTKVDPKSNKIACLFLCTYRTYTAYTNTQRTYN